MRSPLAPSAFVRQVLTLISGTGLAQALPILAAPLLTRLYSPIDFGIFAVFVAITGILGVLATGRYELAILLPAADEDAANLTALAITLSFCMSVAMFLLTLGLAHPLAAALGKAYFATWLYLVPINVFAASSYQALNYWFNRQQQYRRLALNRINRAVITVISMLALGFQHEISGGLIIGTLLGQLVATGAFAWQAARMNRYHCEGISLASMRVVARRYVDFPKFSIPADTINALSAQGPLLVLSAFFGSIFAGFYGLTQRVLGGPLGIISTAFADVFKQRASRAFNEAGNCIEVWHTTFKYLVMLSLVPSVILALAAPTLFGVVFGSEWREAGRFAQLMSPYFFLAFIVSPLSRTLLVAEKQRENLLWQIGLALVTIGALFVGVRAKQPTVSIALYSLSYSMMYLFYLRMSYRYAKGEHVAPVPAANESLYGVAE